MLIHLIKFCLCDIIYVSAGREVQLGLPALVLYHSLHWTEQMQKTTDTAKMSLAFPT